MRTIVITLAMLFCFLVVQAADADVAKEILELSGVKGGLVVHVGCGDGKVTAALSAGQGYLVQGLDPNSDSIESAREYAAGREPRGNPSFRQWDESYLPYADGVVNLLVVTGKPGIPEKEMMRVLAPRGVLCVESDKSYEKVVKPRPKDIDEWTHYLRDSSGNAVARDSVVGPPGQLRWNAGPKYSRNHEMDVSMLAMVSARGRLLYIVDEGPLGINDRTIPEKFFLCARDAFSGVLLWKKKVENWGWRRWKPEMDARDWATNAKNLMWAQRKMVPIGLPRRLVAVGNEIYVSLDYHGPIVALDAATGEKIRSYEGSDGTDEILFDDGNLVFCVREGVREAGKVDNLGVVMSFDAQSGSLQWKTEKTESIFPISLTSHNERIFYHTGQSLVCLSAKDGKKLWSTANDNAAADRWAMEHTILAYEDIVVVATYKATDAFSAVDGSLLWTKKEGPRRAFTGKGGTSAPVNLFVMDGLLWISKKGKKTTAEFKGLDPRTGEVKTNVPLPQFIYSDIHHFRCYRGKATERFFLDNKRGIELLDIQGKNHSKNDWVRGACRYGILPCNGLIYSTPTPCSCYQTVQLDSFNALAERTSRDNVGPAREPGGSVEGPAYGDNVFGEPRDSDWPTFRRSIDRSGSVETTLSAKVEKQWEVELGGKLSQPVTANDQLFVTSVDAHTVHALDAKTGSRLWQYVVDARVDSPPTYHEGMILFGCRNGWVYNLRARDGELIWKYRVAPVDRQIVSYDQLESTWPVHGSVLVMDNTVYAAAGRNAYLDGGIYMVGIDVVTGKAKYDTIVKKQHMDPERDAFKTSQIDGGKTDVLLSDGKYIYMQSKFFDKELREVEEAGNRIYPSSGFIDDSGWHRNTWSYTDRVTAPGSGSLDIGQICVESEGVVYGNEQFTTPGTWAMMHFPGRDNCRLFAAKSEDCSKSTQGRKVGKSPKLWTQNVQIRVKAIVKAGDVVFAAGPPDVIDESDPLAAFEGRKGGLMYAVSSADGKVLHKYNLPSPPRFDGLIAANNSLYLSAVDGKLTCFK